MKTFDEAYQIVCKRFADSSDIPVIANQCSDSSNNQQFVLFLKNQLLRFSVDDSAGKQLARLDCLFNLGLMIGMEMEKQELPVESLTKD